MISKFLKKAKARDIDTLFDILRMIVAIGASFLLMIVLLLWVSDEPLEAVKTFIIGPFTTTRRIGNIIEYAIPYCFTGLGMCFIYAVDRFSMIGEGVFISSALVSAQVAFWLEPLGINSALYSIILILIGMIVGALIGLIPAVLREKLNVNEVVSSIMINYILVYAVRCILRMYMRDPALSYNASNVLPESARLTQFISGTRIHTGIIVLAIMVILSYLILRKSSLGYQMRMIGQNSRFAKYSGMKTIFALIVAQVIGAALAGMGGTIEMLGLYQRFQWENQTGYGNDGVFVAVLAQKNPILVPIASLFLGYLRCGADVVNRLTDVPFEFVNIMQAVVILLVAGEMLLSSTKNKLIFKSAKAKLEEE